ncbi:hypothetical protein FQN57_001269 [Myotisia sp. PD_48]|nr:hypothetical protein FQN57_001269 [Myotisia sp. PD_48]
MTQPRNCKFLHTTGEQLSRNASSPWKVRNHQNRDNDGDQRLKRWMGNAHLSPDISRPLGTKLASFFREARDLVEISDTTLQDVIRYLSKDAGLRRVQELIEREYEEMTTSTKRTIFRDQMLPFFEIITHPNVLGSLVLEQSVGTIYNVIFGLQGRRATPLMKFLVEAMEENCPNLTDSSIRHLEICLLVFLKVIEMNSAALIHEPFQLLAQGFREILEESAKQGTTTNLLQAQERLKRINLRLGIGNALPTVYEMTQSASHKKAAAVFVTKRDPPGGRHDNDFPDICDITIMPTFQEIVCTRTEYLPVQDPQQWHIGGIAGLLDRNFRLLRQDTVGQLSDAIHAEMMPSNGSPGERSQVRTHVYRNIRIVDVFLSQFSGFQFLGAFQQPKSAHGFTSKQRQDWWKNSKRLQNGALVCLTDPHGFCVFCRATEQIRPISFNNEPLQPKIQSLWENEKLAYIPLELVEGGLANFQHVLRLLRTKPLDISLVEFPGILLAAFQPTLLALQGMKKAANIPFAEFLTPPAPGNPLYTADLPPPLYATKPGFSFDLSCLMLDQSRLEVRPGKQVDVTMLQENSTLDNAQAIALVNSLQRRIALIQGPPGTGKSYTGAALVRALLANRDKAGANIGPIICVCYTNHALDQLLEDLLEQEITAQIIRVGSQSKSERLEPLLLRKVVKNVEKTRVEKADQTGLWQRLSQSEEDFRKLGLRTLGSAERMKIHLKDHYRYFYTQFFDADEDGFRRATRKQSSKPIQHWLKTGHKSTEKRRSIQELMNAKIDQMSSKERVFLYDHWHTEMTEALRAKAEQIYLSHGEMKSQFYQIKDEQNLRCLRSAHVVGMTTTGLAQNLNMLRHLQSKVVLCEEAGEVLEAHLLTTLLPSVEHLILIGDHLQLRPQIQNHELSRENHRGGEQYSLDVSLFERLVKPPTGTGVQLPFSTLKSQRRMHPSIAQLVRDTLYPQLEDAPSVALHPPVSGMRRRLYWLHHQEQEGNASQDDSTATSRWNEHEIKMATALVNHLVRQGTYQNGDIAVITPYLGQLHRLRMYLNESYAITLGERDQKELDQVGLGDGVIPSSRPAARGTLLQTVRLATVDNFQGEEAKIVVISLVRSNKRNQCGFLRTPNRINVLLSRARHGMYIIGNSVTSSHIPMWSQVIGILQENNNFGTSLELECSRHRDTPIFVKHPDDFVKYSPEGGCNLRLYHGIHVMLFAEVILHAGIHVRDGVGSVSFLCQPKISSTMAIASRSVAAVSQHALISARLHVMGANLALLAFALATFVVVILSAQRDAQSPVPRVQSQLACRVAHIACARCLVRPLVIIFHALGVFCQSCGSQEIKDSMVDLILGESYKDIDLDANPCIFPACEHFLTIESMDGQMSLQDYYSMDKNGKPISISRTSEPFSIQDIKSCATCRGSLREISRYGRLVRRALLDESTKKLILFMNQKYVPIAIAVAGEIETLRALDCSKAQRLFNQEATIKIQGPRTHQIEFLHDLLKKYDANRWLRAMKLKDRINGYNKIVAVEEQPFRKVHNLVQNVRKLKGTSGTFEIYGGVLQTKGHLQGTALLLRLDIALIADFLALYREASKSIIQSEMIVDLKSNRDECQAFIELARASKRVSQEVEGHIFIAQLYALEMPSCRENNQHEEYHQSGMKAVRDARLLCRDYPGSTTGLQEEVDGAEQMLKGSTFYTTLTNEERMAVLSAMAQEFRGTGHWYYCENGHPFTIGECGGAMELSSCPECGAPVGGQHHRTVDGVRPADDLEEAFGRIAV